MDQDKLIRLCGDPDSARLSSELVNGHCLPVSLLPSFHLSRSSFSPTADSGLCLWTSAICSLLLLPESQGCSVDGICFQAGPIFSIPNPERAVCLLICALRPVCTILPLGNLSAFQVTADPDLGLDLALVYCCLSFSMVPLSSSEVHAARFTL